MKNWKRFLSSLLGLILACVTTHAVIIDMVTVGDPGNADDQDYGSGTFGGVSYTYKIGVTEVSNDQYAEFLNAVATLGDLNGLYNDNMNSDPRGGISRTGSGTGVDPYVYATKTDMGNKPVNYVSFFDAMRFVNWLENGQGAGSTESGVYTIGMGLDETRNPSASFWLPSHDEWYKAAFYHPEADGGPSDSYWLYPTRSDSTPTEATASATGDISNPGSNVANYNFAADWNSQDGNVTTVGSAGASSASYYGTYDQGGNVHEWNETLFGSQRGNRGGTWFSPDSQLRASNFGSAQPIVEDFSIGFRVAGLFSELSAVPEPSTVFLLLSGGLLCWRWARKPR